MIFCFEAHCINAIPVADSLTTELLTYLFPYTDTHLLTYLLTYILTAKTGMAHSVSR